MSNPVNISLLGLSCHPNPNPSTNVAAVLRCVSDEDAHLIFVDTSKHEEQPVIEDVENICPKSSLQWSPDGRFLVVCSRLGQGQREVLIFDAQGQMWFIDRRFSFIYDVSFFKDCIHVDGQLGQEFKTFAYCTSRADHTVFDQLQEKLADRISDDVVEVILEQSRQHYMEMIFPSKNFGSYIFDGREICYY